MKQFTNQIANQIANQTANQTANQIANQSTKKSTQQTMEEAESKPLEFNPKERAAYIRKNLQDIHCFMAENTEEDVRTKFSVFVEMYPELFKKIINRNDLSPIQNMLEMLDRMGEGMSQHQASVVVGKNLVDRYVTPVLNS